MSWLELHHAPCNRTTGRVGPGGMNHRADRAAPAGAAAGGSLASAAAAAGAQTRGDRAALLVKQARFQQLGMQRLNCKIIAPVRLHFY
jgi:hypothetical protein